MTFPCYPMMYPTMVYPSGFGNLQQPFGFSPMYPSPQVFPPPPPPVAQNPYPPPQLQAPADPNFLTGVFQRVNRDKTGHISASELQSALSNGTWKPFNPETVRMMIGMFDRSQKGTINFEEFSALWQYITEWLNCFQTFDRDGSGNIDQGELKVALISFGYRLTDKFLGLLISKFDRDTKGAINFDDFIQCCVVLQGLTNSFKKQDTDQDGWVRITYEEFLTLVFTLKL